MRINSAPFATIRGAANFAIDAQIEQREIAGPHVYLEPYAFTARTRVALWTPAHRHEGSAHR